MKKPKIITKDQQAKLVDNDPTFWDGLGEAVKTGNFPKNPAMNNITVMSCANCFSAAHWPGKVEPEKCPNCSCNDRELVRVRYWINGQPDYSINLLKDIPKD